jgi:hypothetical protein
MNAERLHIIALTLQQELEQNEVVAKLEALINALQAIVSSNNANAQKNLVDARTAFYEAVTNTRSDSFTPAWRQILAEMGGADLFGKPLKQTTLQGQSRGFATSLFCTGLACM